MYEYEKYTLDSLGLLILPLDLDASLGVDAGSCEINLETVVYRIRCVNFE